MLAGIDKFAAAGSVQTAAVVLFDELIDLRHYLGRRWRLRRGGLLKNHLTEGRQCLALMAAGLFGCFPNQRQ